MAYDESGWGMAPDYSEQSPEDALELFRWLRGNTYKLIRTCPKKSGRRRCTTPRSAP